MAPSERTYQLCARCVMDTSDPDITFDADGACSHCTSYDQIKGQIGYIPLTERPQRLAEVVDTIKHRGAKCEHDCIIGLSGGVDSSYVALRVKQLGLRPLAIHLDNGWNSETAVSNIEQLCRRLDIELVTHVLDWEEFRGLQLAFLRASTPDGEIPTDHAIVSAVFKAARQRRVPSTVLGYNIAAELVLPPAWAQGHFDWRYIRSVNAKFGDGPLPTFPHMSLPEYALYRAWISRRSTNILNFMDYDRDKAIAALESEVGWRYYGGKHYESVYTRFYQGYVLPMKFGYDKRRAHQASLILSGYQTRNKALALLEKPTYESEALLRQDRVFVLKKLGLDERQFEAIMTAPHRTRADFPNMMNSRLFLGARTIVRSVRRFAPRFAT